MTSDWPTHPLVIQHHIAVHQAYTAWIKSGYRDLDAHTRFVNLFSNPPRNLPYPHGASPTGRAGL